MSAVTQYNQGCMHVWFHLGAWHTPKSPICKKKQEKWKGEKVQKSRKLTHNTLIIYKWVQTDEDPDHVFAPPPGLPYGRMPQTFHTSALWYSLLTHVIILPWKLAQYNIFN